MAQCSLMVFRVSLNALYNRVTLIEDSIDLKEIRKRLTNKRIVRTILALTASIPVSWK
jgi:hypothetical protein